MPDKLFVYGTLKPGESNHYMLSSIGGTWTKGSVKGELREAGWSPDMHYPGLILDKNGSSVKGYLFTSENLANHWEALDRFEGSEYERVLTDVTLEDGSVVEACIYEWKTG